MNSYRSAAVRSPADLCRRDPPHAFMMHMRRDMLRSPAAYLGCWTRAIQRNVPYGKGDRDVERFIKPGDMLQNLAAFAVLG